MDILLKLSLVVLFGFIGGKIAEKFKLPHVSGYLVVGLFLGPSFFHVVNSTDLSALSVLSEIALAAIAFSIGSEFVVKDLMRVGKAIFIITLLEVLGAIVLVFTIMFFVFQQPFALSIVMASMSAATAPAATLMVIRQFKSKGPLTKTILPVVALDDVLGIMAFGIALSVAKMSINPKSVSTFHLFYEPVKEIVGSLGLGFVIGLALSTAVKYSKNRDDLQLMSLIAIGLGIGLAKLFGFSPLLTNIMVGTTMVNLVRQSNRVFGSLNDFIGPFYLLFFTLAGASLEIEILKTVGWMGLAYILARGGGKMLGAYLGAVIVKSPKTVRNNLGFALLPQGGISIGLSVIVRQQLPQYALVITTVIMFSVLIYEVSGPIFAKIAIERAGEIPKETIETEHVTLSPSAQNA